MFVYYTVLQHKNNHISFFSLDLSLFTFFFSLDRVIITYVVVSCGQFAFCDNLDVLTALSKPQYSDAAHLEIGSLNIQSAFFIVLGIEFQSDRIILDYIRLISIYSLYF